MQVLKHSLEAQGPSTHCSNEHWALSQAMVDHTTVCKWERVGDHGCLANWPQTWVQSPSQCQMEPAWADKGESLQTGARGQLSPPPCSVIELEDLENSKFKLSPWNCDQSICIFIIIHSPFYFFFFFFFSIRNLLFSSIPTVLAQHKPYFSTSLAARWVHVAKQQPVGCEKKSGMQPERHARF